MKKLVLIMLTVMVTGATMNANEHWKHNFTKKSIVKVNPIVFVEKGIQFSVLPNGSFKYSILNLNHLQLHANRKYELNRAVPALRDKKGNIVKVGDVRITYTKKGKILKIGSVDFIYKNGKLKKVGDLKLIYLNNGGIAYKGFIQNKPHLNVSRRNTASI